MKEILDPLGLKVVKKLSETRWSTGHDGYILFDSWSHIKSALFQVAENLEQKIETRDTAKALLDKINNLGIFNKNQFKLQRSGITLIVKSIHLWRNIFYSNAVNHPEKGKLFKLWLKHKTMHKSSLGHKDQT